MSVHRPNTHWGTHLWGYIHTICIIDSDEPIIIQKQTDKVIHCLKELPNSIICSKCAEHFKEALTEFLESGSIYVSMKLFRWSVDFHNDINKKLEKSIFSYEDAVIKWTKKI